ncbi:MAG: cysteine synthase family protein, partial [Candidatus Thermoplasmatota archaeon]|nr:cysteine synthase family protein [Candidatus Thermoplasmatota archaeon]
TIKSELMAKLECMNPGGSVKDRIGIAMIEAAESEGLLRPGGTIVEATAGNTGVGLAIAAAVKSYKMIFVLPDKMSAEKIDLLRAYGAQIVVTRTNVPPTHPDYYVNKAEAIARSIQNSFVPNQFSNPANPEAHYRTTGPEIWKQTGGRLDYFVAGIGTGGTISGVARFLKEKDQHIQIIGADPQGSVYEHYKRTGVLSRAEPYMVEGIGEEFIPKTVNLDLVDRVITVSDKDAFLTARALAKEEGIMTGGSGGAAIFVAIQIAREIESAGLAKRIVTLLPDTGRNYLSKIYSDEWMKKNSFI